MNYIKPEDIRAYVEQNPTGIAGMSEELAVMVNHFAKLIVRECAQLVEDNMDPQNAWITPSYVKRHFGIEE